MRLKRKHHRTKVCDLYIYMNAKIKYIMLYNQLYAKEEKF